MFLSGHESVRGVLWILCNVDKSNHFGPRKQIVSLNGPKYELWPFNVGHMRGTCRAGDVSAIVVVL